MEELRIDLRILTPEEKKQAAEEKKLLHAFNMAEPDSETYIEKMHALFHNNISEGSYVASPLLGVRFYNVTIGKNVYVNSHCLMMAAGGITIEDNAMLAANVQLISNNHDLYERAIITCKPICIEQGAWIGAGATILPGVCIGKYAVVGAGSVVTKNVAPWTIVAGNPAKLIRTIPQKTQMIKTTGV